MPRLIGIQLIGFTVLLQSLRSTTGDCVEATNVTCLAACRCEFCIISRESWGNLKLTCKAESGIELENVIKQVPSETVLLHLERNKLSKIDGGTFRHLKKLERLYIANNKLDGMHIDDLAFDGLENLQHLDLSSNSRPGITVGNSEWFKPLKQLRHLSMRELNLHVIPADMFTNNVELENLLLYANFLRDIPANLFSTNTKLRRVLIQSNNLKTLPNNMLNKSPNIEVLSIANNKFEVILPSFGIQHLENLNTLLVSDNPFQCGCDLVWFRNWLNSTDVSVDTAATFCSSGNPVMLFNPKELRCKFPIVMVVSLTVCGVVAVVALITAAVTNRWRIRYGIYMMKCRLKNKKYEEIRGDDDEFKYDAFLSHSSKDEDWILTVLHSTLENPPYNYKLCLDYRDFIIGETIADNIVDAVQKSRKTVFILTKSFIESEWCYFELEMVRQQMFDEHRDLAILIMKENLPTGDMPGLLKYLMRKGNYIEWSDNKHGQKLFWSKLDAALRSTKKNMV